MAKASGHLHGSRSYQLSIGADTVTALRWDRWFSWLCFLASLGDGLLILLISASGRVTLCRRDWFEQPGVVGYVFMLAAGLVIGLSVEWMTVSLGKWWAYTEQMLIIPGLGIGIVPLAQMLALPCWSFGSSHCGLFKPSLSDLPERE